MKTTTCFGLAVPLFLLALTGCARQSTEESKSGDTPAAAADKASIPANLAKLSPEDRKLAEEQQYCAVETKNLLGSMGKPYKVIINEQPVFLCCDGCETRAKAHADRTLAKVQQLKESTGKASPK